MSESIIYHDMDTPPQEAAVLPDSSPLNTALLQYPGAGFEPQSYPQVTQQHGVAPAPASYNVNKPSASFTSQNSNQILNTVTTSSANINNDTGLDANIGLEVLKEIRHLRMNHDRLHKRVEVMEGANVDEPVDYDPPEGFPIQTLNNLEEFEKGDDPQKIQAILKHLKFVSGGLDAKLIIHHAIRCLITPELARQYTWTGCKSTKCLLKSKILRVMFKAVKQVVPHQKEINQVQFKTDVQAVLRSYKQIARNNQKNPGNGARERIRAAELQFMQDVNDEQ